MLIPFHRARRRSSSPGAVRRLVLGLALVLWMGWAPSAAARPWIRPVPGEAARPFALGPNPFAGGQHRGVDLVAATGARVKSACGGVVAFAGVVPSQGRVVSVRCGRWRVSYMPLGSSTVHRGAIVAPGSALGTVGSGHGGLHVGVRREGRRFGYVDPLVRFRREPTPPVAMRPPGLGRAPRPSPPRSVPFPHPVAVGRRSEPAPEPSPAPWPVWLGLGLLLKGAAGGRTLARRRGRRRVAKVATASVAS